YSRTERFRVVLCQAEDIDGVQDVGETALRGRLNGEQTAHVLFAALELVAVASPGPHLVDLFEDFDESSTGDLVPNIGGEPVEPGVRKAVQRRGRRIRVALVLSDVANDPGVERASKDGICERELVPTRIVALDGEIAERNR